MWRTTEDNSAPQSEGPQLIRLLIQGGIHCSGGQNNNRSVKISATILQHLHLNFMEH